MFSLSSTLGFLRSQSQLKKPHGWESDYYNSGIGPRLALTESQTLKITQQIAVSRLCHQMCFFPLFFTALDTEVTRTICDAEEQELGLFTLIPGTSHADWRLSAVVFQLQCSSVDLHWHFVSFWLVVPAAVLNSSVWGIEFTLNNTSQLIVPNKIICLLAKAPPGICISGTTGRKNKEAN